MSRCRRAGGLVRGDTGSRRAGSRRGARGGLFTVPGGAGRDDPNRASDRIASLVALAGVRMAGADHGCRGGARDLRLRPAVPGIGRPRRSRSSMRLPRSPRRPRRRPHPRRPGRLRATRLFKLSRRQLLQHRPGRGRAPNCRWRQSGRNGPRPLLIHGCASVSVEATPLKDRVGVPVDELTLQKAASAAAAAPAPPPASEVRR